MIIVAHDLQQSTPQQIIHFGVRTPHYHRFSPSPISGYFSSIRYKLLCWLFSSHHSLLSCYLWTLHSRYILRIKKYLTWRHPFESNSIFVALWEMIAPLPSSEIYLSVEVPQYAQFLLSQYDAVHVFLYWHNLWGDPNMAKDLQHEHVELLWGGKRWGRDEKYIGNVERYMNLLSAFN